MESLSEKYGQLLLSQLFTLVWYGNWDEFENTLNRLPSDIQDQFPFYKVYDRTETELWHKNYFEIPGEYFIPPYLSSYEEQTIDAAKNMKEKLLQLISSYENLGFYYELDKETITDHFGSLTAFMTTMIGEEIKAIQQNDNQLVKNLQKIKEEICENYLQPGINKLWDANKHKISDPFFEAFIPYFISNIRFMSNIKTSTGG